jgi:hypothetical protein
MGPTAGGARQGGRDHELGDGGRARFVLAALVTPAEVQDNQPALDLLCRTSSRTSSAATRPKAASPS